MSYEQSNMIFLTFADMSQHKLLSLRMACCCQSSFFANGLVTLVKIAHNINGLATEQ